MIAIAPEGMTTNGKQILRFRSGAFVHGAPVLPVCIQYRWRHLNPAWTVCSEPWHVVRMLTQIVNIAHVQILPAYTPTRSEVQDPSRFAEHVRHRMVRRRCSALWLDVPADARSRPANRERRTAERGDARTSSA